MEEVLRSGISWGRWDLVAISIVVHLIFLFFFISSSFVRPKKVDFRSKGILVGFVVALYFEMYGIPLTIFLLQPFFSNILLTIYPVPFITRIIGSGLILAGFVVIYLGWKKIHLKEAGLVTKGIYAFIRHPQYVGLSLLTFGQLIQWPTLTGFLLWPFLVLIYYKLALKEEKDVEAEFGKAYLKYKSEVPRFFPEIKILKARNA